MKKTILILLSVSIFTALACSDSATMGEMNRTDNSVNSQNSPKDENRNAGLRKQIEQIARESKGRVGVSAAILETGETVSLNSKEPFPMQSVYKFPIAMAVLNQVDAGKLKLDQKVKIEKSDFVGKQQRSPIRDENPNGTELSLGEILRYAVSESDGTASDVLLKLVGGAAAVDRYLKELNVTEIIVADTEKEIGSDWKTQYRNWAAPESAVGLLGALHERRGLSEQSQALLLKLMTETETGMKRLKGLLPAGTMVAHKTGTSNTKDGITAATNDIGIVNLPNGKHLAIAVFVSDSAADEMTREKTIAKIARVIWDAWSI